MNRNVASRLTFQATKRPEQIAIASPTGSHRQKTSRSYDTISFRDLDQRSSSIAAGLQSMGMKPGLRIALLVRFSEDFIALVFALLKAGVTLILIDPGMGRKNLIRCLSAAEPDGFVAISAAQIVRLVFSKRFPKSQFNVTVGPRLGFLPRPTLASLERHSACDYQVIERGDSDDAAIIFTTGSTGPPKGVLYTHGTFNHQIDQLVEFYNIQAGGTDLSCFPLFGLFNAVMGTTTILPDMNPIRPADVDPPRLLDAIDQWSINQAFGSPALWTAVGTACDRTGRRVPSLKNILSAGAPVSPRILRWMRAAMADDGTMHTPYGATEALPVASIESREVLEQTSTLSAQGYGTCVGRKFSGIEWRVIAIDDDPIDRIEQTTNVADGEMGELMVCGPVVSQQYVTRTDQNAIHKVRDGDRVWHRIGDVGYFDEQGRFWYCGRKAHRVRTMHATYFTDPCEAIFNTHASIHRSALIGLGETGRQQPMIVVEPWSQHRPKAGSSSERQLIDELQTLAKAHSHTQAIEKVVVHAKRLPTDIRHNSKIFREQLAEYYKPRNSN
jgi:olefin beta-lactone synthetase